MTDELPGPIPQTDWWPAGVDEQLVRDCNCEYCQDLVEALEDYREGMAPGREADRNLASFA